MKNQHTQIKGYRDLTQEEIDLMNELKQKESEIGEIFQRLGEVRELDHRWLSIARTSLQQGFMAAVRAIARPVSNL